MAVAVPEARGMAVSSSDGPFDQGASQVKAFNPPHRTSPSNPTPLLLTNENKKDILQQEIERLKKERETFKQGMDQAKQELEQLKNEGEKWKKQQVCELLETDKYFVVTFHLAGSGENCDKITRSRAQNSHSSKQQKWISQNSRVG